MKVAWRAAGAVFFLIAAVLLRSQALLARGESEAWHQLVTLQFDASPLPAAPAAGRLTAATSAAADARRREATVRYWLGRYEDLARRNDAADPDVLFIAANAAFRAARQGRPLGPEAARQLEPVLQAYGRVLHAVPRHADASYNFEYVVRLQEQLRVAKGIPPAEIRNAAGAVSPAEITELPQGPTVHGLPGTPPPDIDADDLEILRPKDPGERESGPDQAPGGTMRRRG